MSCRPQHVVESGDLPAKLSLFYVQVVSCSDGESRSYLMPKTQAVGLYAQPSATFSGWLDTL
jgi:hypothetical protein